MLSSVADACLLAFLCTRGLQFRVFVPCVPLAFTFSRSPDPQTRFPSCQLLVRVSLPALLWQRCVHRANSESAVTKAQAPRTSSCSRFGELQVVGPALPCQRAAHCRSRSCQMCIATRNHASHEERTASTRHKSQLAKTEMPIGQRATSSPCGQPQPVCFCAANAINCEWSIVYYLLKSAAVNIAAGASPVRALQKFRLPWWGGLVKSKRQSIFSASVGQIQDRRTVRLDLLRLHER